MICGLEHTVGSTEFEQVENQATTPKRSLPTGLLQHACTKFAQKSALTWLDEHGKTCRQYSFKQFEEEVEKLCRCLSRWRVSPGARVVLLYPPCLDFHIAFWACLRVGVVAVPAGPPAPGKTLKSDLRRLAKIVDDCQPGLILTNSQYRLVLMSTTQGSWLAGRCNVQQYPSALGSDIWPSNSLSSVPEEERQCFDTHVVQQDHVAYLQYTSGSTSAPRGVMVTHGNLAHNMISYCRGSVPFDIADLTSLNWLPQHHDLALVSVCCFLCHGCTVTLLHPSVLLRHPIKMLQVISETKSQHMVVNDTGLEVLSKAWLSTPPKSRPRVDLSALCMVPCGMDHIRGSVVNLFLQAFQPVGLRSNALWPMYTLAEHVSFVSMRLGGMVCGKTKRFSHGHPPGDIVVKIVDPLTRSLMLPGQSGEVWIDSPSKALGYWGCPDLSKKVFEATLEDECKDGCTTYLRTGDKGWITEEGLFICGRLRDMIDIGTRSIAPQDIEQSIMHNFYRACRGQIAVFVSQTKRMAAEAQNNLVRHHDIGVVMELLPPYPTQQICHTLCDAVKVHVDKCFGLRARSVVLVEAYGVPTTSSGKVQRGLCREMLGLGQLPVLHGGRLENREDSVDFTTIAKFELKEGVGAKVAGLFGKYGVARPDVSIPHQGIPSVQLLRLLQELKNITGVALDLQVAAMLTAEQVVDVCIQSHSQKKLLEPEECEEPEECKPGTDGIDDAPSTTSATDNSLELPDRPSLWCWHTVLWLLSTLWLLGAVMLHSAVLLGVGYVSFKWMFIFVNAYGHWVALCLVPVAGMETMLIMCVWAALVYRVLMPQLSHDRPLKLWSLAYCRWWTANRIQQLVTLLFAEQLKGTQFLVLGFRMLGAKIGSHVYINSTDLWDLPLVVIGNNATVNEGVTILGHYYQDGCVHFDHVVVGKGARLDPYAVLQAGLTIPNGMIVGTLATSSTSCTPGAGNTGTPGSATDGSSYRTTSLSSTYRTNSSGSTGSTVVDVEAHIEERDKRRTMEDKSDSLEMPGVLLALCQLVGMYLVGLVATVAAYAAGATLGSLWDAVGFTEDAMHSGTLYMMIALTAATNFTFLPYMPLYLRVTSAQVSGFFWRSAREYYVVGILWAVAVAFVAYSMALMLLTVVVKWLVIGRVKPQTTKLASWTGFRLWLVSRIIEWGHARVVRLLGASWLQRLYMQALGSTVGSYVIMEGSRSVCYALPDMVSLGRGAVVGTQAALVTHWAVDSRHAVVNRVVLDSNGAVGLSCVAMPGSRVGADATLGAVSCVSAGSTLNDNTVYLGAPATPFSTTPTTPPLHIRNPLQLLLELSLPGLQLTLPMFVLGLPLYAAAFALAETWDRLGWGAAFGLSSGIMYPMQGVGVLLMQILAKWLLLGRRRPGTSSRFGIMMYLQQLQRAVEWPITVHFLPLLQGSPVLNWYLEMKGCPVEVRTVIDTLFIGGHDMVRIGRACYVGRDAVICGAVIGFRAGQFVTEKQVVELGDECNVGCKAVVLPGSEVTDEEVVGVLEMRLGGGCKASATGEHCAI